MAAFQYRDSRGRECEGEFWVIRKHNPIEMDVEANGRNFHVIAGIYANGNYVCIPNWSIGSELAQFKDEFWNAERLRNYTSLHEDHIVAVVRAIAEADKWMKK